MKLCELIKELEEYGKEFGGDTEVVLGRSEDNGTNSINCIYYYCPDNPMAPSIIRID